MTRILSDRRRPAFALAAAVLLVALVVALAALSPRAFVRDAEALAQVYEAAARLQSALSLLSDVESGSRGFVITGRVSYLGPYEAAVERIADELSHFRRLVADQPEQLASLKELEEQVKLRVAVARNVIQVRRESGFDAARQLVLDDRGALTMERIRRTAAAMIVRKEHQLALRRAAMRATARRVTGIMLGAGLLSLLLTGRSWIMLRREIGQRRHAVEVSRRRSADIEALALIGHYLQACASLNEALTYATKALGQLFPGSSGALFLVRDDPRLLEPVAEWGTPEVRRAFTPSECWGLRICVAHACGGPAKAPLCGHLGDRVTGASLCLPLLAQGRTLGLLQIGTPGADAMDSGSVALAHSAAEQLALALVNLQLREALRRESLRDALTGVHNRRFLDEALPRELELAQRHGRPLAVALIDADHFKRFNDRFGHDAGDLVLRAIGDLLRDRFRGSDLVCRYGGEEFVVVLPEATLEDALERAEEVRDGAHRLALECAGRELPPVTLSIGVAAFPEHGSTATTLLRAADTALYAAKSAGRDRVVAAEAGVPTPA